MPRNRQPLPGFGLTLGFTLLWLSALLLVPLILLFLRAATAQDLWRTITDPRALASYRVTLSCAFAAAVINALAGSIIAWTLVRIPFPGRHLFDAIIDLPFALPTAVSGIALTAIHAHTIAFTRAGIIAALTFIGLPFVIRTLQPAIQDLDPAVEEAAAILGASELQTLWRITIPSLLPSLLTGFALAFARGLGEYGSVIFIAGNIPFETEITPLLVVTKLEQFDYAGATAIGAVQLLASFLLLLAINGLQWWTSTRKTSTAS